MAGVTRTKNKHGQWRAWFNETDLDGKRRQHFFWATKDRRESKAIAQERETQARERAANPDRSDAPAAEVMAQFFAWGSSKVAGAAGDGSPATPASSSRASAGGSNAWV